MKVALIGYGKTNRVVEEVALERGVDVVERFTGARPLRVTDEVRRTLSGETVLVDFSVPDAVVDTAKAAARLSLNLVVGTTGWDEHLDEVRGITEEAGVGLVQASNFSLGVNIFYRIAEEAARLFSVFESYDPFITDWHHRFKKDSPSGTALELRRRMSKRYGERELPITSQRAGYVPSVHTVGFDSSADSVVLSHQARNREGFAEGALLAAKWIAGRRGCYEFQDVMNDLHPGG